MNIHHIAHQLATQLNLNITYFWSNDDVKSWMGVDPLPTKMQRAFYTIMPSICDQSSPFYIKIDLNAPLPQGCNDYLTVLCHEIGHILHSIELGELTLNFNTVQDVIDYEAEANKRGIELYKQFKDPSNYWHNHLDRDRMKQSYKFYTNKEAVEVELA